jgi:hypothetical protein
MDLFIDFGQPEPNHRFLRNDPVHPCFSVPVGTTRMTTDFEAGVRLPSAKSSTGTRTLASGK